MFKFTYECLESADLALNMAVYVGAFIKGFQQMERQLRKPFDMNDRHDRHNIRRLQTRLDVPFEEVQQSVKKRVHKSTQEPPSSPAYEADPPVCTAGPPAFLANDQSLTEIFLKTTSPRKPTSVDLRNPHNSIEKWLEKTTEPQVVFDSTSESTLTMGFTGASFYVADL
ncbi:hypothetical protein FAGAP_6734 [Fusarium agapanthi]|uniref:Uncharacterized protein n=1 Tax=Fusarium agapanthi TaxID=1803897 RepID=A0A9P5EDP7_9HYPO|nr:hypothetical protein FAGAP_6734 [Fusarium agapanthi]